jgi:hypothetical protein
MSFYLIMDKLKLTGLDLGHVFNYRCGHAFAQISTRTLSKQPYLNLKTVPKPVLGSLPLAFVLPDLMLGRPQDILIEKITLNEIFLG